MKNNFKKKLTLIKIFSVFIFYSISYHSVGQFSVKILNEDFNSNLMRWDILNNDYYKMDITGGKYILNNKAEGSALTSSIDVPNLQTENFSIVANLSKLKGIDNNGFGLIWGGIDANNEYEFVISANGFFKISKWENGQKEVIIDWTYQSSINMWDLSKNELKIECLREIMRFYINGNYVAATKYFKPFGPKIGFVLNETMYVEIDDIIAENLTIIENEKPSVDLQNINFNRAEFVDNNSNGILENNENGTLNIEILNNNNIDVNDLVLTISPFDPPNGLMYNPLVMIDNIKSGEIKHIKVQFTTNKELSSQILPLTINLSDLKKSNIDTTSINIETKAIIAYDPDVIVNSEPENTYQGTKTNDEFDNCAMGCLLSVITGIIAALFE